jgi:SAM-dependent methyltransferase
MDRVNKEKYKYDKIYAGKGTLRRCGELISPMENTYGNNAFLGDYLDKIIDMGPLSIVDVGCGQNKLCKKIRKLHPEIKCVGVDFSCSKADIVAEACEMPFKDKEFDVLTSLDTLEHIPEDEIDDVIDEFKRVGNRFFYSISTRYSVLTIDGENLHPLVKPPVWWFGKIKEHGGSIANIWFSVGREGVEKKQNKHKVFVSGIFNND